MKIILRGEWIGAQSSAADVDEYVANFPDANGIMLIDGQNHMLDVVAYTGWDESKTWAGLSYTKLKEVIDRFHYHGWIVILASDNLMTKPYSLWEYVNNSHREFAYVNGYGKKVGIDGDDAIPAPTGQGLFAFLKNYTTPDTERNIPAGVRFIDVYTERLKQMILDKSFEWDGWFPVDGWIGFVTQWYFWLSPTQQFWGRWEGTNDISKWVSISDQELVEWANSSYAPTSFPKSRIGSFSYFTDFDSSWSQDWEWEQSWSNATDDYLSPPNSLQSDYNWNSIKNIATNSSYVLNYTITFGFVPKLGSGNFWVFGRSDSYDKGYALRIEQSASQMRLYKGSNVKNTTSISLTNDQWYQVKFEIKDNSDHSEAIIRAKIWVNGTSEPLAWNITYTDTDPLLEGTFGFRADYIHFRIDNLNVTGEQYVKDWNDMTNIERGRWIRSHHPLKWYHYWQERFAKAFAQVNKVFDIRPPEFCFGAMMSADRSSTWTDGVVAPRGMLNFTLADKYGSFSHYWIDSEALDWHVPENALSTGLIGTKLPHIHEMAGNKIAHWGQIIPAYEWKMNYLVESITYSWVNGTRYRTLDPSYFVVHAHSTSPQDTDWNASIKWVKSMYNILGRDDLIPIYLGPTYILPVYRGGQTPIYHFNYTFTQYADVVNIQNHPEYIKPEMGTLLLDMTSFADSQGLTGLMDRILQYFADGTLNIIAYDTAYNNRFKSVWDGVGEAESLTTFHMTGTRIGTSQTYEVLDETQLTDPIAKWIASGYYGNRYETSGTGTYYAGEGFIPIVNYTDGRISMGIYYNSTSGRFLYGRNWLKASQLPKAMINRALYWVTNSPFNTSEPLLDIKVFNLSDGTIILPMFNMKDYGPTPLSPKGTIVKMPSLSSTMSIDAPRLGLSNPLDYIIYWQSDWNGKNFWTPTEWSNVNLTLEDGADILVIKPKPNQPTFLTANQLLQNETWDNEIRQHKVYLGEQRPFNITVNATFYIPEGIYPNDNFKVSCNGTSLSKFFNLTSRVLTVWCSL